MKTNRITALIVTALLSVAGTLRAQQPISGNITFAGTVSLNTASAGTATAVTAWHGAGGLGMPTVFTLDGDFATFIAVGQPISLLAPWTFNSGPVAGFWNVGGFTFDLIQSSIFTQGGSPPGVVASGSGTITGHGFAPTPGNWSFSTQDPAAQGVFSFSAAILAVPEPSAVALIGLAFVGMGAFRLTMRKAPVKRRNL